MSCKRVCLTRLHAEQVEGRRDVSFGLLDGREDLLAGEGKARGEPSTAQEEWPPEPLDALWRVVEGSQCGCHVPACVAECLRKPAGGKHVEAGGGAQAS